MSENPFATPQAHIPQSPHDGQAAEAADHFDLGRAISEGFLNCTQNIGLVIGIAIVGSLCVVLSAFTLIGVPLLIPVFAYGLVRFLLNMHDGQAEFGDLFAGFQDYGRAVGSFLLFGLIMVLLSVPGQALQTAGAVAEEPGLSLLGGLVGFLIFVFVTVRLYFAPFFMVDQDFGAIDAVKASWAVTDDQKLMTFLLALVAGLIGIAGFIVFFIGVIFTGIVQYAIWTSAYRQMYPAGQDFVPGGY